MIGDVTSGEGRRASPAFRWYRCKEGRVWVGCQNEAHWRAFSRALGRPELAYPGSWDAAREAPPRGRLGYLLERLLAVDAAAIWAERLEEAGVPFKLEGAAE